MKSDKKFVSIVWGYFKHMQDMAPEESYHLHILKVAKNCGYKPYIIIRGGKDFLLEDPNLDKDIIIIDYTNILYFLFNIIKLTLEKSVFYVNSYEWQSFLVPFISRKTIFMAHTQPKRQNNTKQKIQNFVYNFFTKIRLNNEEEKKFLLEQGIKEDKLQVVPLIVSQSVFYKTNNNDRKDLVYFGNVTEKKNLLTILRAFEKVKAVKPDIKINVVGNMWDKKVEDYINNSKHRKDIILHGFLPNEILVKKLNENLIYLNSSLDEGQCVAVYDAALCGLNLCLPKIMSFTHVFRDSALFHDIFDHDKLAQNILRYLDDKDLRDKHIDKNIEMIKKDYSIETIENKLKQLICLENL